MNILVTNDDGINSPGIYALVLALREIGDVIVMAPLGEQSAVGHALTVSLPLRVTEFHKDGAFFGFAVSGTPADCVKLALRTFLDERKIPMPDIVVSGINHGRNTAVNIIYSGTVSAATEATVLDVPAIAVSLTTYHPDADFGPAAEFMKRFTPHVAEMGLPRGTLLNVNIPAVERHEIRGVSYTKQGSSFWEDEFEKRVDPQERPYYWLKGRYILEDKDSDIDDIAIRENRISITPIHYDLTNYEYLDTLRKEWPQAF
ncbi:MAG TPA: 5'/3'-nucleotidase SurE [Candidatus Kapabacteria bacterium]|jgi:5'-nucleotidase|nr:5'/3'-nucleotidase SurE [Candidatus Kapabacteria bacterium]